MKIKKYISVFLMAALLFTAVPQVFAGGKDQPGSSPNNPIVTTPDNPVELHDETGGSGNSSGNSNNDPQDVSNSGSTPGTKDEQETTDGTPGSKEKVTNGSGGSGGSSYNSDDQYIGIPGKPGGSITIPGEEGEYWMYTGHSTVTVTTTTSTHEEPLYWEWYLTGNPPGSMTIHNATRSASQNGGSWRAGSTVLASFSAKGDYHVVSELWGNIVTTTTIVTEQKDLYKHYSADGLALDSNFMPGETKTESHKSVEGPQVLRRRNHYLRITSLDPIRIPEHDLETTRSATFSRNYVYTERCLDAATNKPFELEVVYDFSCNTKIVSVPAPKHTITRYQGNGTMVITPKEFRILSGGVGSNHVKIWAKFVYPKAAMPNQSPMRFEVVVKSTNKGNFTAFDEIDVPVNTYNVRFTDLPDSQRGKFYPISGLYGTFGNYIRDWGTITYGGVQVP